MHKSLQPKILMDEDGLCITAQKVTSPSGEFLLKDIDDATVRVSKPMWGPLLLSILGTVNLAVATETMSPVDFIVSLAMLGFGLSWWLRGQKFILSLKLGDTERDVWYTRHAPKSKTALELMQGLLKKRRAAP